jgi:hypothetical protein
LFYRHCKQTFERAKLRSRNPDHAMIELHWSLLGMWALGLHSHHHLLQQGVLPERVSSAGVLRAYRQSMREYKSPPDPGESLTHMLNRSLIDDYERDSKTSRDYPRKKQEPDAGRPILRIATRTEVKQAKQFWGRGERIAAIEVVRVLALSVLPAQHDNTDLRRVSPGTLHAVPVDPA